MSVRPLVAGNWKMNGLITSLAEISAVDAWVRENAPAADVLICPPATLVHGALGARQSIAIGGQDCHSKASGAHTGDISAEMLADVGATHVIVGHSERRQDHGETDGIVAAKAVAARHAGLTAVICLGESEAERDGGRTVEVIEAQLAGSVPDGATAHNTVVAYEPIWAIGTGRTPTLEQIAEVHEALRARLVDRFGAEGKGVRLLYGGSVKPSNAAEIAGVAEVNGALVGGASLKSADFTAIIAGFAGI